MVVASSLTMIIHLKSAKSLKTLNGLVKCIIALPTAAYTVNAAVGTAKPRAHRARASVCPIPHRHSTHEAIGEHGATGCESHVPSIAMEEE